MRSLSWLGALALSLSLVCVCLPLSVSATRATRATRAQLEEARGHMERGQAYFLQGRYAEAAVEFDTAYGVHPFTAFLFNAGVAYETGGDLRRALEYFDRYVSLETNASERTEVQTRADGIRGRIEAREAALAERRAAQEAARLAAEAAGEEPPPIVDEPEEPEVVPAAPAAEAVSQLLSLVAVETEPEGASVIISRGDEVLVSGPAPLTQTLDQGHYHIVIDHPDYNRFERDFDVQPGVLNRLFLNLSQGEFLGYVRVLSEPPGASVYIDDREQGARGQTPFEGPIQIGEHRVWVERPGFEVVEREFEIGVGEEVRLEVPLERVSYGRLRVLGNLRGARVFVDGAPVGAVPCEVQVDAGPRAVRVTYDGMKDWETIVDVERGQLHPIRVRLKPAMGRGGAIAAGVIGALFLGGAIGASVYVDDLYTQLDRERQAGLLQGDDERLETGFWVSIAQYVGYGVAGVGALLALFYGIYDDLPPSEGTVLDPRDWTLLPMFSPAADGTVIGLSLRGVF